MVDTVSFESWQSDLSKSNFLFWKICLYSSKFRLLRIQNWYFGIFHSSIWKIFNFEILKDLLSLVYGYLTTFRYFSYPESRFGIWVGTGIFREFQELPDSGVFRIREVHVPRDSGPGSGSRASLVLTKIFRHLERRNPPIYPCFCILLQSLETIFSESHFPEKIFNPIYQFFYFLFHF